MQIEKRLLNLKMDKRKPLTKMKCKKKTKRKLQLVEIQKLRKQIAVKISRLFTDVHPALELQLTRR